MVSSPNFLPILRIGKARADGGIEQLGVAAIGAFGLGHDEGRAAHAFDAAGDEEIALAAGRGARGVEHRGEAAAAQPVDGHAAGLDRQSAEEGRVARDIARVFAGLVGAADDGVFVIPGLEGIARDQRRDHPGEQVIRPYRRKHAGMAADGRAQTVIDIGIHHGTNLPGET